MGKSRRGLVGKTRRPHPAATAATATAPPRPAGVSETVQYHQQVQQLGALVEGQSQVLEMISQGLPLAEILEAVVHWVEAQSHDGVLASLLLLDHEGQHLQHGAAPSLPKAYNDAIHGTRIGPAVGSCGTAAFTRHAVITEDIARDPRWDDFRELALAHDLRACWSTPLIGRTGQVLGTFAMYYRQPRLPTPNDWHIIHLVSRTATLAIEHKQAEEEKEHLRLREQQALRRAEAERQRLYALFMEAPTAMAVLHGPEHIFELGSPLGMQVIGAWREVVGKPIREALPELDGQGIYQILDRVYTSGESYEGQETLVRLNRSGSGVLDDVYFNFVFQPTWDETGRVDGVLVHAIDVTGFIRARSLAEKSEDRYRALFDAVPVAVYSCDASGRIQEFNQSAVELWGRVPVAERNERYDGSYKLYYPDGQPMPHDSCPMAKVLRGESLEAYHAEIVVERPNGKRRTVITHPQPLRNERGKVIGAINCLYDITDRKQAEEAAAYLAAIVSSSTDAIVGKTLKGIITSWNASAQRMFGYTPEEIIGRSVRRLIPPDRQEEEDNILARLSSGEHIEHFETVRVTKDGRHIDVSLTISPIKDRAGRVIGASKTARDITERKRGEEQVRASAAALRRQQERLQIALAASGTGTFRWNPYSGEFMEFDENLKQLYGFAPDESTHATQDLVSRVHPDDMAALMEALDRCREGADLEMEYRVILPDGSMRWLYARAKMEHEAVGLPSYLVGACMDITARKHAEEAVRESEEKFRTLADNISHLAWMAYPDGHIFWYNQRWYDYTGTTFPSQEGWGWRSMHDPQVLPEVMKRWRHSLASGEPFNMVFPLKGADGKFRSFLTQVMPVKDERGEVVRWFGTNTDLTEQMRLQDALRKSERALQEANQRKDEFLSIASHELRTPLTSAKANIQFSARLLNRLVTRSTQDAAIPVAELEPLHGLLGRSERSLNRLGGLVDDLLDVSRIQAGKLEMRLCEVDLVEVVREAVEEEAAVWLGREVRLQGHLGASDQRPVWVRADPDRIRQVVINYLSNALKYTPAERPIDVLLEVLDEESWGNSGQDDSMTPTPTTPTTPVARVSVRDQGPGLTPEHQTSVFERFYRVEDIEHQEGVPPGLGLGLYICRTIIERHNGQVGVRSVPGEGATFWFTLPLTTTMPASTEPKC